MIIHRVGIVVTCLSVFVFPWPLACVLATFLSVVEPLLPLTTGLLIDTLYYSLHSGLPIFSICGALMTVLAYLVRTRLRASIIDV